MAQAAKEALYLSISLIENYEKENAKKVSELEDLVDRYEDELGTYLMKISNADLSNRDSQTVSMLLHCIGDFERISDHACNIMETAKQVHNKNESFSDKAREELLYMKMLSKRFLQ